MMHVEVRYVGAVWWYVWGGLVVHIGTYGAPWLVRMGRLSGTYGAGWWYAWGGLVVHTGRVGGTHGAA